MVGSSEGCGQLDRVAASHMLGGWIFLQSARSPRTERQCSMNTPLLNLKCQTNKQKTPRPICPSHGQVQVFEVRLPVGDPKEYDSGIRSPDIAPFRRLVAAALSRSTCGLLVDSHAGFLRCDTTWLGTTRSLDWGFPMTCLWYTW